MKNTYVGMEGKILDIMRASLATVDMQDTVLRVEQALNGHNLSSMPVIDSERHDCFGIISLKDVTHFHSLKRNPRTVRAWEMCSYRPLTVSPESSIHEAARLMVDNQIHHVVVVDNKVLKGIVSSLDILAAWVAR